MRGIPRYTFRVLVGGAALILCTSLMSCASQRLHIPSQFTETGACSDYAVLQGREPPFQIDLEEACPFSRWNVPWPDKDIVGLDIVWLKCPAGRSALPEFALVINKYTTSDGLICLVDETGIVRASIRNIGLIQKIRPASIAPIREPQLLVYTNPDHGSGSHTGEAVLLAIAGAESRILLTMPRYDYFLLQGDNYSLGLPFLISSNDAETRIAIPLFRAVIRDELDGMQVTRLEWSYSEYEWERVQGVFRPAHSPAFRCFFSPDAWTWSPDYDVGGKGYVLSRPRVTPLETHPAAK
jgi:hypothetical protein